MQSFNMSLFDLIKRENPDLDLYRLLHTGGRVPSFSATEVHEQTARQLAWLKQMDEGPRLGEDLQGGDVRAIVRDALRHFSVYHRRAAAVRRSSRIFHEDRNLLLYYGNRLDGYPEPVPAPIEVSPRAAEQPAGDVRGAVAAV